VIYGVQVIQNLNSIQFLRHYGHRDGRKSGTAQFLTQNFSSQKFFSFFSILI
jgi:hypothetical protein